MKNLSDYINEHLEVNEGIIGDVIRKLLDAGINWINKGFEFLGDSVKGISNKIWNEIAKDNDLLRHFKEIKFKDGRTGKTKEFLPEEITPEQAAKMTPEQLKAVILKHSFTDPKTDEKYTYEECIKTIENFVNAAKQQNVSPDFIDSMLRAGYDSTFFVRTTDLVEKAKNNKNKIPELEKELQETLNDLYRRSNEDFHSEKMGNAIQTEIERIFNPHGSGGSRGIPYIKQIFPNVKYPGSILND